MKVVSVFDAKTYFSVVIRELKALSDEVGHVGISLEDIKRMKEEGRK